ncbi:hypothetical protein [Fulvimonas yonginensis]|uniref:DUF2489 domain-containing protein n=1 Tax=Fulvimonas yonginensis TaxID=1495200 RepID=A0ABU8JBR1_9GAMM
MPAFLALGLAATLLLLVGATWLVLLRRRRRLDRRTDSMRRLLDLADQLEADLKTCRSSLKQAHAVMSLNPDQPAAGEKEAKQAIDAGLRSLLQQRLWIRDCAPEASQEGLDEAAADMSQTRARLRPLVRALERAHHELDDAMREHIRREHDT